MLRIGTIRAGTRLIAVFSSLVLAGATLANEATREYFESLKPGRQIAKKCFNEFGQLVLTPDNIGLCADLPEAAALGFDITPRQELARACYNRDGMLVITPRNVDLCASLPSAAIVSLAPAPAFDDDLVLAPDDLAPAGGAAGTGIAGVTGGGSTGTGTTTGGTTGTTGTGTAKSNKGHGNGDEGGCNGGGCSDNDNPGKRAK